MRIHLPAASTLSTTRPAMGESSSMRASCGSCVSNFVTTCPCSARLSVRAARKMVSPSGIAGLVLFGLRFFSHRGRSHAAHLVACRRGDEAALFEERTQRLTGSRLIVDCGDQQSAAPPLPANRHFGEFHCQCACHVAALGLIGGKKN